MERKTYSIASVTVAHNAVNMLPRQLEALQRQSRSVDEIIVVNNASTDPTREMLEEKYGDVTILNLPKNVGVGGGFSEGLRYAIEQKAHDWVWLLDDDSIPEDDGLEQLLKGLEQADGPIETIAVLAPIPVHAHTQLSYPGLLWRNGWVVPSEGESKKAVFYVDAVISSGSLMRSAAVKKVGLPRADFFMDFVDFEHCLRFRRAGYKIALVSNSLLNHTIGNPRTVKILGISKCWTDHAPYREFYLWRNYIFTIWKYYPDWKSKLWVVGRCLRHAFGILAFGQKKLSCLRMMYAGYKDGRAGQLGIRFLEDTK